MNTALEGKTTALVSYITIIGSIIAIFMNIEPKMNLHDFIYAKHLAFISYSIV